MIVNSGQKSIVASFAMAALLLGVLVNGSSQARIRCATDKAARAQDKQNSATSIAAHYRSDVVPCADAEQDRPVASVQPPKDVAPFIDWIVAKTGWAVHEAPPIHFVPYGELVKIFTGGKSTDFHVEGLYSDEDHSIYLPEGWRGDDLHDRSVLLHELVHHLQYLNKVKAVCSSEYDWQALELQVAWLREQGVEDALDLLGLSPLYILMLRQCE